MKTGIKINFGVDVVPRAETFFLCLLLGRMVVLDVCAFYVCV